MVQIILPLVFLGDLKDILFLLTKYLTIYFNKTLKIANDKISVKMLSKLSAPFKFFQFYGNIITFI